MDYNQLDRLDHLTRSPLLLSPEASAQLLGISRSAIYRLMKCGDIESLKIGRSRRISSESLRGFVVRGTAAEFKNDK
jgi:excisionase family DNA binding protein